MYSMPCCRQSESKVISPGTQIDCHPVLDLQVMPQNSKWLAYTLNATDDQWIVLTDSKHKFSNESWCQQHEPPQAVH